MVNEQKPSDWVQEDEDDTRPGQDTALEMLGGVLLAAIVIALSVGLYFIVTRW